MPIDVGLSMSNSSGAKSTAPFSVTSGGGKTMTMIIIAVAAVALVGLVLWFKKR